MGMKAVHTGEKAKEIRNIRFETANRIVDLAHKQDLDFVVIAGDTFEHQDVDDVIVKKTVDILNSFDPIPVYILPGNHDPYTIGGIWDRDSWERIGSHVKLLTESSEIQHGENVALYPCPLKQKQSHLDPTSWIPPRIEGDERIRIGIAHGALDILPDESNFPIDQARPDLSDLDYLALGDWHSYLSSGKAAYSGTMEPTGFGERDSGNVLIVTINKAGSIPEIESVQTNILKWVALLPEISDATDVENLDERVKNSKPLESLILRISPSLSSSVEGRVMQRLETLKDELEEQVFYLEWNDPDVIPFDEQMSASLPDGVIQQSDETLAEILGGRIPHGTGREYAQFDQAVVQTARLFLHRFAGGK
jgi:DNA repair exonuclease SbcCD nuclease subunit